MRRRDRDRPRREEDEDEDEEEEEEGRRRCCDDARIGLAAPCLPGRGAVVL